MKGASLAAAMPPTNPNPRLLAFSSLMARTGQKFAMLMFAHFLAALFNDTAQWITPNQTLFCGNLVRYHYFGGFVQYFFGVAVRNAKKI